MDEPTIEELLNEPIIEEIDLTTEVPYTLNITLKQFIYICQNQGCVSNPLIEKQRCPFCGDKVKKYNRVQIVDENIFD